MTERCAEMPALRAAADRSHRWAAIILAAAVLLAYANSFPGAFFFDDDPAIRDNPSIRNLAALGKVLRPPKEAGVGGRPVANVSLAVSHAFGGDNPWAYHAGNVVLHLGSALLLFGITRRTLLLPSMRVRFGGVATTLAGAMAALWALHPVTTNVVDYMSQRTEGLMSMFYLLTLYAWIRSITSESKPWMVATVAACALGMASKEGMVTAPVVLLLYDRTFVSGTFAAAWRRHGGRLLATALTWVLLGALMIASKLSERGVGFGLGESAYTYALTECRSVVRYLQVSLWPHPLVFDYGPNYLHSFTEALPSAVVLAAVLVVTVVALIRAPAAGFTVAWFFVLLAPTSSFIPIVQQPCAESRVYLASAGVVVLVAAASYRLAGRRGLALLLATAFLLGIGTWQRNPAFGSEIAIWSDTVARQPGNARAANNLGNALLKAGRMPEAVPYFETAIRLSPDYADARNNLGVTLLQRGKPGAAVAEFERAVHSKANYADAFYNLGEAYLQTGRPAEAIEPLREAIRLVPTNAKAHNNLGIALLDTGHVDESLAAERTAVSLNPDMPEAHYNLGNSLLKAGQREAALAAYDRAIQLNGNDAKAYNNSGVVLMNLGRWDEARARFESALRLNPNYPEAKGNLAAVLQHAAK